MQKKKIIVTLLIISLVGVVTGFIVFKNYNKEEKFQLVKKDQNTVKRSPYTLEEMYQFTKEGSWPKDAVIVIEDWYSYFSKNTPFINSHGEELSYEEYTAVKNGVDGNFFEKITGLTKDFFEGKYY